MVVDTSAVLAILLEKPEAAEFAQRIEDDPAPLISAASVFERIIRSHGIPANRDLRFSVNQKYATGQETLRDGDELAIFTAVSGG